MEKTWTKFDEDKARKRWEQNRELQLEFQDVNIYLAYCQAEALNQFKVWDGVKATGGGSRV
jgi:hypothetical protein